VSDPARILIVEDEDLARWSIKEHMQRVGHDVDAVPSGEAALAYMDAHRTDFLLLDVKLPGIDGLQVLREAIGRRPDITALMMSSHGTIQTAVEAMKLGALDFLVKPFSFQELDTAVMRALTLRRSRREIAALSATPAHADGVEAIIGDSAAMDTIRDLVKRIAANDQATVLIQGESGVGKEVVARAIHAASARCQAPFCQLNCGALPEHLLESELFGHERGAFTDAHTRKLGLVETAQGGTLLLDELGEMPKAGQVKLLQLLENRTFRRVGGTAELTADVRIIAATNVDLEESVRRGEFRNDLFFRLNVFSINVPPLREHVEDVERLAAHFIARFNQQAGARVQGIAPEALGALTHYDWPGNVRELRNVVERALIMDPAADTLRIEHLPSRVHARTAVVVPRLDELNDMTLAGTEKRLIELAIERANGNKTHAARELGISRDALRYRMRKYDLLPDDDDDNDDTPAEGA